MKRITRNQHLKSSAILGVLCIAAVGVSGCSSQGSVSAAAPEVVRGVPMLQVRMEAVPDAVTVSGTVQPETTAQIAPRIVGTVESISVTEGSTVRAGQVLARIDTAQAQQALQQAQAAARAAQQNVAAAQSAQSLAAATLQRYELLRARKSVSAQEYDEVLQHKQAAQAQLEAAQANAAQAAAAVAQAQTIAAYASVSAPFAGIITRRWADPGAMAMPGTPLFTLESAGPLHLEVNVDERDRNWLRTGESVPVQIDGVEPAMQGRVLQIYPAADGASRSITVKIGLPASPSLRSGLYGSAQFSRGSVQGILVPQTAIMRQGNLAALYVAGADGIVHLRYVTLGQTVQNQAVVLSGLAAGETVVAAPQGRELDGKRVEAQP